MSQDQLPDLPEEVKTDSLEQIFSAPSPDEKDIDISFFSHKHRKSTQLLAKDGEGIRGRREWLDYDLIEPAYVTAIDITATGYEDYHEMELSYIDSLTGNDVLLREKFNGTKFSFQPKAFVRGFGLRPDLSWSVFKSQYISRVEVRGLEQGSFFEVIRIYENAAREKARIESSLTAYLENAKRSRQESLANEAKITDQQNEITTLTDEIERLTEQVASLTTKRDELTKRIESGASIEKERNERVKAVELSIRDLNGKRERVSDEISVAEVELKRLKDEINLFPTEIAGYVSQGTNNIKLYSWLSVIPLLIVAFVTYRLFVNADRLLDFDISGSTYDVLKFLLSRSPYVVVSAAVLGICYSLIRGLISEIVNINRRRQELFKINIIARDVSLASQHGLKLSPEQAYDLRTQTKMELLKEHLKMNIGEDYSYSPNKALLDRIAKLSRPKPKVSPQEGETQA